MNAQRILHTHNLTTGYKGHIVSAGLDLSLYQGQMVCLIGPNGAGKSTLLRTIAGLQAPTDGRVLLMDDDVSTLSQAELARRVSLVLTERPDVGLMNGYALVALGRHPHTGWLGRLTAHDTAMIHWAVDAVSGRDIAHKPLMELSDGQRQKLMIARALAQDPALMILDEPTAYLDLPRRVEVMTLLAHLAHTAGQAILTTTHDLDLALRTADCLWLMSADGSIQTGTPEDLVLNGAFERAFHSEGICFDPITGTFHTGQVAQRAVRLTGQGLGYLWTQRALARAGWRVAPQGMPEVEVYQDGENLCWTVQTPQTVRVVASIAQVLSALEDMTTQAKTPVNQGS